MNYGPGDEITWGPCMGHPMDPRTPEPEEDGGTTVQDVIDYLRQLDPQTRVVLYADDIPKHPYLSFISLDSIPVEEP